MVIMKIVNRGFRTQEQVNRSAEKREGKWRTRWRDEKRQKGTEYRRKNYYQKKEKRDQMNKREDNYEERN